ncbi:MAG: histidine kinase [Bacteroidetes bacterium]|nr:histidine kinase [Bacteroidota bacterium]
MQSESTKSILLFFLIVFIPLTKIISQTPPYYHYTTTDGLASSTVYDVIQDRNGFLWVATINGLNKFDGNKFNTYRMADGLNSNSITAILEGEHGELFIGNHEKGINILRNGKFENYISEIEGKRFNISQLVEAKSVLYGFESYGVIGTINNSNNYLILTHPLIVNRLTKTLDNNLIALTSQGVCRVDDKKLAKLNIEGLPEENIYSAALENDGSYLAGGNGIIYRIKNDRVIVSYAVKLFENNIVFNLLLDSHQNIWFSIKGKGIYIIPHGSEKIINLGIKLGLEKTQITSMIEDDEGNIWIATFGKGVYCLNNLYISNFTENDGLINNYVNCIQKSKSGKLILGTTNGISILEKGVLVPLKYNSGQAITGYINNIISAKDYLSISLTSEAAKSEFVNYKDLKFRLFRYQSFCETSSGLILFGSIGNNIKVQKKFNYQENPKSFYAFGDSSYLNRINYMLEDSRKNIWIGSNLGLCKLTYEKRNDDITKWGKTFFASDPVLNSKMTFICEDRENNLWFAGSKGVARYNLNNNSVISFTNILGHDLSGSTSIAFDNKNRIWIGNLKGIYVYDGKFIKHIDSQSGLTSNEVLSLFYDDKQDKLYAGTSNGLSELDINLFDKHRSFPPKIFINKVISGDSVYTNYSGLIFDRDKNDISIDISAINYSSPRSVIYKYKLNEKWDETNNNVLNFSSLQNGTYNLQIIARTQNSDWSQPYFLSFVIKPGIAETVWFKLGVFLLLFSFALSAVIWRMKQKTKKMSEQLSLTERINSLKHEALSAMMNPHFIFNALNSVQYLINIHRNEEANDYIATMAKLIRKNLDTAGNGFILLSEEINRLKLYLDLEKLRFQDRFSYEIIYGKEVDADSIFIPNMIIQPFVENTIWHGIINQSIKGLITISFSFEEVDIDSTICKSLVIKITDNGIGINKAKMYKKEDHVSKGIQIIEERLKLLSAKMQLPKPIMVDDLSSRNENSHGTEVIISLPSPLYKYSVQESDTPSLLTD